jgi:hypothetical protein
MPARCKSCPKLRLMFFPSLKTNAASLVSFPFASHSSLSGMSPLEYLQQAANQ